MALQGRLVNKWLSAMSRVGAFITETVANNKVFEHQVFGISKRFSISSEEVINIGIDASNVADTFAVLLPFTIKGFDAGPLHIDLYIGSTFSAGTEWVGSDRNLVDPVTPDLKWYYKPTITDVGTLTPIEDLVCSNGAPASARVAGETSGDLPINLQTGIKYIIRITNSATNTGQGSFSAGWFEIPFST